MVAMAITASPTASAMKNHGILAVRYEVSKVVYLAD